MDTNASDNYDVLKQYEGPTKQIAFNPFRLKVETVYPEDEVPDEDRITLYWSKSHGRYVTVPE